MRSQLVSQSFVSKLSNNHQQVITVNLTYRLINFRLDITSDIQGPVATSRSLRLVNHFGGNQPCVESI